MSRPPPQSSSTSMAGLLTKPGTKPRANVLPLPAADAKLFLTNLKLLDLDRRPDWPNLTAQTFLSKAADQKQRISGVEWALFRLFEIWDPEETSQKLKPFFPPLEPLQSLNLRAALYRCLNDLKKNGVLGRDSVLRKTMLDECKGEKFFEILAIFSTTVLKKILHAQSGSRGYMAVAAQYSTTNTLSIDKQASLLPLLIAHKVVLGRAIRRRSGRRRKYNEFNALLVERAEELRRRIHRINATPQLKESHIQEGDVFATKKQLTDHWIGDRKWLDSMLYGDTDRLGGTFLVTSFDHVWSMVEEGRKLEEVTLDVGLLQGLQERVQEQRERIKKWQAIHKNLHRDRKLPTTQGPTLQTPTIPFRYDSHLDIQVRLTNCMDEQSAPKLQLRPEYGSIIADLNAKLGNMSPVRPNKSADIRKQHTPRSSVENDQKTISQYRPSQTVPTTNDDEDKDEEFQLSSRREGLHTQNSPPRSSIRSSTPIDSEATLVGRSSNVIRPLASTPHLPIRNLRVDQCGISSDIPELPLNPSRIPTEVRGRSASTASPTPSQSSFFPSEPPIFQPAQSLEESIADQIISSVANATPSPVKKNQPRLSLLDRTRMSMAHTGNFQPIIEDSPALPELAFQEPPNVEYDRRASLLDRTRLSMASMNQNARPVPKKGRRSTTRHSNFPVNQFDTPRNRKSINALEEAKSGVTTPKEELFSDDIDYDRVFKSRPRVAQSPVFSPDEAMPIRQEGQQVAYEYVVSNISDLALGNDNDSDDYNEGVTGVDLGDVDQDSGDDGFTQNWDNSPLRRARVGSRSDKKGRLFV